MSNINSRELCPELFLTVEICGTEIQTTLQTSQNFLILKMLQKSLKICVIMPAFFDPRNGGKI